MCNDSFRVFNILGTTHLQKQAVPKFERPLTPVMDSHITLSVRSHKDKDDQKSPPFGHVNHHDYGGGSSNIVANIAENNQVHFDHQQFP